MCKLILALYVDIGLASSDDEELIDASIDVLQSKFKIVSKTADQFLGIRISRSSNGDISLDQLLYIEKLTKQFGIAGFGALSRSLENPSPKDVSCLKRVTRYLNSTINFKFVYKFDPTVKQLECYSDADFAGYPATSRSTTGILIKYADAVISWISKRQQLVADSSCDAELITANETSKETIWISRLFRELINLSDVPVQGC
ncbi:uncharacterized protein LOC135840657 [Planococcus citri]|uniref:uncharacterized protein LOC135840657 n=1 Tax=Planococcus citri TaxID=170843 RepID=UPI0031F8353D